VVARGGGHADTKERTLPDAPQRFHLDLRADHLGAVEEQALELGAAKPDHQPVESIISTAAYGARNGWGRPNTRSASSQANTATSAHSAARTSAERVSATG
jgi:hypothetical protein